ncbi:hypothetical protein Bca4012_093723 [Brassica carinata]
MEELDFFKSPDEFPPRRGGYGLIHVKCGGGRAYPNSALVKLYAKLGLHHYNWLEGTNFELDSIMKFNMRGPASPYYITLVACLPSSGLQQIFQVLVEEERLGILDLTCPISRSQVLLLRKDLSNFELEIVQVAIESLDDKDPPSLKSKVTVIYIAYKDLAKARTGESYHCQAVVRRVINKATGTLSIQGDCCIEEAATASAASKKRSRMLRRRLGVHKLWRLSSPRWYQTYKNYGLRSSLTS